MKTNRLLRRPEMCRKLCVSASTLRNWENDAGFPRHFMLSPRCAVWDEAEVDAWIQARRAASIAPQMITKPGK